MSENLRTNRHETMGQDETLSVELPDGIGVVHIRTGNVHGHTGDPVIAVEVVSDARDIPACDGRLYEPVYKPSRTSIVMTGRLAV